MTDLAKQRAEVRKQLYAKLDKECGKGFGRALVDQEYEPTVRASTGMIGGDYVSGGGIPMGRVTEIYGGEGSGKTTLAISSLVTIQRQFGEVAYIDAEHGGYDPEWARILGLNVDEVYTSQPDTGEQVFKAIELYLASGVKGIVVDSVSALVTRAELEGEVGDAHIGRLARLMSQEVRRVVSKVNQADAALIFINQLREKVGVMFGSPETTSGGKALKYYASLRLDVRKDKVIKDGDESVGMWVRVKTIKNRGSVQYRTAKLPLTFGVGFAIADELIDLGAEQGLVTKSGAWYSLGDTRMGLGRAAAIEWIKAHPQEMTELRTKVVAAYETNGAKGAGEEAA